MMDKNIVDKNMIDKILNWAEEKGIFESGTIQGQAVKTAEELSELIIGISKDKRDVIKDSIGDVYVTLIIGCYLTFRNVETVKTFFDFNLGETGFFDLIQDKKKLGRINSVVSCLNRISVHSHLIYNLENILYIKRILNQICFKYHIDFNHAVESAYNEIKNKE